MASDLSAPIDTADHVRGEPAGRQLVIYGDFECPYTAQATREIARLTERGVAFEVVFRYFPLVEIHPHALAAAKAAEAAARQDRFWEMHDLLFRNQLHLAAGDLGRYAKRLGLDRARFESDLGDPATVARIQRDVESGIESGVEGTPTLFIDGRGYEGPRDADSLANALGGARAQ
jgi:protein-disulfide isomerase